MQGVRVSDGASVRHRSGAVGTNPIALCHSSFKQAAGKLIFFKLFFHDLLTL